MHEFAREPDSGTGAFVGRNRYWPMVEDIERALLGAVLIKGGLWAEITVLRPSDFCLESHRLIFAQMAELTRSRRPIEMLTVVSGLDSRGKLQAVGGPEYVARLLDGLPDRPVSSIKHYVDEVLRHGGLRRIAAGAEAISKQAASDPGETVGALSERLLDLHREVTEHGASIGNRITRIEEIPDPFSCESGEVVWIIPELIPSGAITIIAGEAGAGKTWLAMALARAVALGADFLGRRSTSARILYLDRENPLILVRSRLQILCGGADAFRPWGLWCEDQPPLIGDPRLLEFATKRPMIILDSMIRFHRADENSATEMAQVMRNLRCLASVGASVVVLHHRAKSETSSYRGSSDIVAGADAAFALAKHDDILELRTVKNRFAAATTVRIRADLSTGTFLALDSSRSDSSASEIDHLARIISTSPGVSQNKVLAQCGISRRRAIELLHENEGKLWNSKKGPNRSRLYFPIQVVLEGSRGEFNRNRSLGGSESRSYPDTHWGEPLGTTHAVPVPPPFMGGNREPLEYHGA